MASMLGCTTSNGQGVNNSIVENFDISRYLGQWYEIARFDHSFERGMEFTRAFYTLNDNGTVKVENSGIKKGKPKTSVGKAYRPDPETQPALMKVSFFGPFYSEYRVMWIDGDYKYVLVGSKSAKYLWILSRDKTIPQEILGRIVDFAKQRGYDTDALIWVKQDIASKP